MYPTTHVPRRGAGLSISLGLANAFAESASAASQPLADAQPLRRATSSSPLGSLLFGLPTPCARVVWQAAFGDYMAVALKQTAA